MPHDLTRIAPAILITLACALHGACGNDHASTNAPAPASPSPPRNDAVSQELRDEALTRAQVWRAPRTPIADANLGAGRDEPATLECRFVPTEVRGTTPKFECEPASAERLRVKYGDTPEIQSEVATTRLLRALGFGADQPMLVERLRCYGCPSDPYKHFNSLPREEVERRYTAMGIPRDAALDFPWVIAERKFRGRTIASPAIEGWNFFELDRIDPARGGAPRAHVDALRLLAVFLAHWDTKPDNQRLVCLTEDWRGGRCRQPFAFLQDVGATFGPNKVNLPNWRQVPIWANRATCDVSMKGLPFDGASFVDTRISERGRRFLGGLLSQLREQQLVDLFRSARFEHVRGGGHPPEAWAQAFQDKVRQITEGPACPQA